MASIASADDESDRRSILSAIESKLGSAASELSDVKSDSDDGDIRDADGYIDQVRDLIGRLDRVKGDDSRAREVVDRYPGYIERYRKASAAPRGMKGYQLLVYDWFDGELLGVPRPRRDDPASSFQRFRALPATVIAASLTTIFELHAVLARAGWIAVDFYDGSLMFDFASHELRVIDLDLYARGPFTNTMGRRFGSSRFMAPEELELGARIDERTTVFNLGRVACVFLGDRGTAAQLAAATRACSPDPTARFASVGALLTAWLSPAETRQRRKPE